MLEAHTYDWAMLCASAAPVWRSFKCDFHGSYDDLIAVQFLEKDLARIKCGCLVPFNEPAYMAAENVKAGRKWNDVGV